MTHPTENGGKKYLCIGAHVISRSDGDRHYISARRLPDLYNVNPADCIFKEESDPTLKIHGFRDKYIVLLPGSSGPYILPKQL